ncbi:MAG TPA: hypothetical protein VGA97_08625, partial [Acidimicrobiia bacterium]
AERAEAVAGWATGVGIGLIVFMVTWIVAARVAAAVQAGAFGAVVAMGLAVAAGVVVAFRSGRRLAATPRGDAAPAP